MQNPPLIVTLIIIANVLLSFRGFKDPLFFEKYKFQIAGIKNGQRIRLLSAGFLHVDTSHLFFNMFTLYFFSDPVLQRLGLLLFLVVYFGSLLIGNFFAYYFYKNVPYYSAVGASGAVSGVLFSAILLFPEMKLIAFLIPIPIPAYLFAIGYLGYTLYGMKKQNDNIGHTTHLGGALGGILITILGAPYLLTESLPMIGVVLGTVLLTAYFIFKSKD